MKRNKYYFLQALLCFQLSIVNSQDIHFSQFWEPLAFTNPSLIGNFDGDIKLSAQYRNQWSQFNTPLLSMFGDFTYKSMKEKNYWAASLSILKDQLNGLYYNQYRVAGSFSYQNYFTKNFQAGAGFQVGSRFSNIEYNKLTFDRQFDPNSGQFVVTNPNFENFTFDYVSTPYFNLGLSANLLKGKILHTFDFSSMYVMNNKSTDVAFYQPFLIHTNYHNYIQVSNKITLMPKVGFIYTSSANSINSGLLFKYVFTEKLEGYAGMLYRWGVSRNSDALIPAVGIKANKLKVGISYDANTSGINQEGRKDAYELSVQYIIKFPKNKYFSIDCMRL